jgi:hypothetical protein
MQRICMSLIHLCKALQRIRRVQTKLSRLFKKIPTE